jgi:hypothetical protein
VGFAVQLSGAEFEHGRNLRMAGSVYRAMINSLRVSLADETDCLYYVHTPVGTINVSAWNYAVPGFVAITGEDENKKYRFVVFSEEQVRYLPLEIKRKKLQASKGRVGFNPSYQAQLEDQAGSPKSSRASLPPSRIKPNAPSTNPSTP